MRPTSSLTLPVHDESGRAEYGEDMSLAASAATPACRCANERHLTRFVALTGGPGAGKTAVLEAAQRAIATVQREIERTVASDGKTAMALCDRGTLDGLAYWPGVEDDYFLALRSTRAQELDRYTAVIHLRTPSAQHYNHSNPVRLETVGQAQEADARIAAAWRGHKHVHFVESCDDFLEKARRALDIIQHELPSCCRHQPAGSVPDYRQHGSAP